MKEIRRFLESRLQQTVALAAVTVIPFMALPWNGFVWDDFDFIVNWSHIRSFANLPLFLEGITPAEHEGVYRPVRTILYALSYQLYGENATAYHIQSLLLHVVITLVLFFVMRRLIRNPALPFLAALLFGIHPVHTEAIAFATTSFDIFGVLFGTLAVYTYLRAAGKIKSGWFAATVTLMVLAVLTYELMLAVPVLILWIDFVYYRKSIKNRRAVGRYLVLAAPGAFYFLMRFVLHIPVRAGSVGQDVGARVYVMSHVFVRYLYVLIAPVDLNIVPMLLPGLSALGPTTPKPLPQPPFTWQIALTIIVLAGSIIAIFSTYKKQKEIALGLGWILIALIPVSNIIPAGTLYAEKYLYLASFGFCVVLGWLIIRLARFNQSAAAALCGFMLLSYSLLTFMRVADWKDSLTLWAKTAAQSSEVSLVHNQLGIAHTQNGQDDEAIEAFKQAIRLNPQDPRPYFNISVNYRNKKDNKMAFLAAEQAYRLEPGEDEYLITYAGMLTATNRAVDANTFLLKEINERPSARLYNALAKSYIALNDIPGAEKALQKAIVIDPSYAEAYNNLATVYLRRSDTKRAKELLEKAASFRPHDANIYYNLANLYLLEKDTEKARLSLEQALHISPTFEEANELYNKIRESN